jgi:hypothetical protein
MRPVLAPGVARKGPSREAARLAALAALASAATVGPPAAPRARGRAVTSRRATRRQARLRVTVATTPASTPGRALERRPPAEAAAGFSGEALAAAIERTPGSTEPEHLRAARLADDALRARLLQANWAAGDPARLGYGLLPWWRVARVEVPPDLRRDLVIGAGRPLECYEVALDYALNHADHDVTLVHGLLVERGRLWPHAWCELGGTAVFDPAVSEFLDRGSFYQVLQATVVGVYTPTEAARLAVAEGSPGPWGSYERGRPGRALALEVVAELSDAYAATYPDLFEWVQEMRSHDDRFAGELANLMRSDLLAIPDLLATLVERPELWRGHVPGAPWGYRPRKDPESARVIHPAREAT